MRKKHVVRLTEQERTELEEFLKSGRGSIPRRRRANILLGVDKNGLDWPDAQVAEAELIALRLGEPPEGYLNWSLRLLVAKAIELEVVESLSHESVRRTLKRTNSRLQSVDGPRSIATRILPRFGGESGLG